MIDSSVLFRRLSQRERITWLQKGVTRKELAGRLWHTQTTFAEFLKAMEKAVTACRSVPTIIRRDEIPGKYTKL